MQFPIILHIHVFIYEYPFILIELRCLLARKLRVVFIIFREHLWFFDNEFFRFTFLFLQDPLVLARDKDFPVIHAIGQLEERIAVMFFHVFLRSIHIRIDIEIFCVNVLLADRTFLGISFSWFRLNVVYYRIDIVDAKHLQAFRITDRNCYFSFLKTTSICKKKAKILITKKTRISGSVILLKINEYNIALHLLAIQDIVNTFCPSVLENILFDGLFWCHVRLMYVFFFFSLFLTFYCQFIY